MPGEGAQRSGPFLLEAGEVDADGLQRSAFDLCAADGMPGLRLLTSIDGAEPGELGELRGSARAGEHLFAQN